MRQWVATKTIETERFTVHPGMPLPEKYTGFSMRKWLRDKFGAECIEPVDYTSQAIGSADSTLRLRVDALEVELAEKDEALRNALTELATLKTAGIRGSRARREPNPPTESPVAGPEAA